MDFAGLEVSDVKFLAEYARRKAEENERLRKVLEFYADDKTYYPQGDNVCSDITMDYGSRAREALK